MSHSTLLLRGLLFLSLLSVSNLTFSVCTATPSYDPATGKITVPCINVPVTQPFGATQTQIYSINLQQRPGGAFVFDLDLSTVKLATDTAPQTTTNTNQSPTTTQYKIGDRGPAGGIVFYVDNTGLHGLEAQRKDANVWGNTYDINKYPDGSVAHVYIWAEANTVAQSYGAGWHLPTKDELNLWLM